MVHTTLNLDYQREADARMAQDIDKVNALYLATAGAQVSTSNASYLPLIDMLGFSFDIDDLMYRNRNATGNAKRDYSRKIAPGRRHRVEPVRPAEGAGHHGGGHRRARWR